MLWEFYERRDYFELEDGREYNIGGWIWMDLKWQWFVEKQKVWGRYRQYREDVDIRIGMDKDNRVKVKDKLREF